MAKRSVRSRARSELTEIREINGAHVPTQAQVEAKVNGDDAAALMVQRAHELRQLMFDSASSAKDETLAQIAAERKTPD